MERAHAELEIEDSPVLSAIGDLAPILSAKDKVRNFVNSSNSDVDVLSMNLDHPCGSSEAAKAVHADGVADRMIQTAHLSGMVPSAVTGQREEGDILYVASAKRSPGRPAAAAMGSAAKQVGFANREGLSGKDSKLQNRKDSDALLPSYDADKW